VGRKLFFNTTFHPQLDGQIKTFNRVLNQYLQNYVNNDIRNWGGHLSWVEFCINSTTHLMTKMSPFELPLGKEIRKPMDLAIPMG
jgi:hypothetical protein